MEDMIASGVSGRRRGLRREFVVDSGTDDKAGHQWFEPSCVQPEAA